MLSRDRFCMKASKVFSDYYQNNLFSFMNIITGKAWVNSFRITLYLQLNKIKKKFNVLSTHSRDLLLASGKGGQSK